MALDERFTNLKTKYFRKSVILSCIGGVCAGLFATGAIWLILKLVGIKIHWAIYIAVGVAVAAGVAALLFFLTRPTDKAIAKKLDDEYGLKQKVQTMLEYDGVEGDMLELQRADAAQTLAAIKPKKPAWREILTYILVPFLAFAMFITAIVVPSNYKEDKPFNPTNWQLTALRQLIGEVEECDLDKDKKDEVLIYVSSLLELVDLKEGQPRPTTGQVNNMAKTAMNSIMAVATLSNSYKDISTALSSDELLNNFSKALKACAKTYGLAANLKVYSTDVAGKRGDISLEIVRITGESIEAYEAKVQDCATEPAYRSVMQQIATAFESALATLKNVDGSEKWAEDELKVAVKAFSDGITNILANTEGYSLSSLIDMAKNLGKSFADSCADIMDEQVYTEMMCEYTRRKVASIFGIIVVDSSDPDDPKGDDDKGSHGGAGEEVVNRGGNDVIYYPDDGTWVVYGDVLDPYWKKAEEIMERQGLSEELKKKVQDYFEILARGSYKK